MSSNGVCVNNKDQQPQEVEYESIKARKVIAKRRMEEMSQNFANAAIITNGDAKPMTNGVSNGVHLQNGVNGAEAEDEPFLTQIFSIMQKDIIEHSHDKTNKVVDFKHPAELFKLMDFDIRDEGEPDETLINHVRDTVKYSVRTGHPYFFNQLFAGFDQYGLAGALVSEAMNTSQYTYEVSPVFTLMEDVVLRRMRECVGWTEGDGIFCPGGSISNMFSINLARYHRFPQIKTEGMHGLPKVVYFTSEQSHYSIKKGVTLLGIGVNNLRFVPCNNKGQMDTNELEQMIIQAIEDGYVPLYVNGTAGTTVAGAYDNLNKIADIAKRYGMWFHTDCCWGGGALLSRKYKHLLSGINRADSVAWNPHKMMGTPLQCCAFLTRHNDGLLQNCHSANATYLFQQDKFYDVSYDTGDKSIQCGRKVDVFKLWMMWKSKGNAGFEVGIDNAFSNAEYLRELVERTPGFRLVFTDPECTNVCFWYIPKALRGKEESAEWWQKIGKVAPIIKEKMVLKGSMLVGYQPLGQFVNFFRFVICNLKLTQDVMEYAVNEIELLGKDLIL